MFFFIFSILDNVLVTNNEYPSNDSNIKISNISVSNAEL